MSKNIFVYGDWESLVQPTLIGVLNVDLLKGKEIFSFEYDTEWLQTQKFSFFDPDLQLYKGRQYTQQNKELFGFSIAVTNTDDHLRNHGFLFDQKGLRLSPMYDVNPNPDGVGLSLNIDDMDNSLNFDVAIDTAKYFDIKKDEAAKIVDDIKQNIKHWKAVAEKVGISRSNMMRMENCFKF